MILIADSGSTKTEWCIAEKGEPVKRILTAGMNPFFQTPDGMEELLKRSLLPEIKDYAIESICFYGAGCASPEKNRIVRNSIYKQIQATIEVQSDLFGAARALCGRDPGIACILGTGSNSCLYNGKLITENISPLGYILGDEGSGAVLGKLLVGDCLKNQLPDHLKSRFLDQFQVDTAELLDRVYKQPFPNRYLATLSRFLLDNIDEPRLHELVYNSFRSFFIRNVMLYSGFLDTPIHFTGSIAYYYQDILKEAARSLSLEIQSIEQTPMPGLLAYHA